MISLIYSFVCCGFVMDCQRGRLLGHMGHSYYIQTIKNNNNNKMIIVVYCPKIMTFVIIFSRIFYEKIYTIFSK